MNTVKAPRSLRSGVALNFVSETFENYSGRKVSAVAGLMAVATFSGAEAQQSNLPPVTVDAPVARPKPAASKPTAEQIRARNALRRAAKRQQAAAAAPVPYPNAGSLSPDRNPYADAAAPYKVDHLQASGKFPEPILNTPKTITVLSKELLADEHATTLKQAVLNTAGVTLGTGEGGSAFGDRFFVRGFDTRNDVFVDGVRDSGVSVRENFFTEQVEILRGPGSSFAGRGTTGGAINIVTKQATTDKSFYEMESSFGTDQGKRVTLDVNQVISPTFAIRADGLFQNSGIAGRDYATDNRDGGFVAATWTPIDAVKVQANYFHVDMDGLPDFGVPYYRPSANSAISNQQFSSTAGGPFPSFGGSSSSTFYGLVNRDFYHAKQDMATLNTEVTINPDLTWTDKVRASRSSLNYIGVIAENPTVTSPNPANWTISANPQSRFQVTDVVANQNELTYKSEFAGFKHTTAVGTEISREAMNIDTYNNLSSEALPGGSAGTGKVVESPFAPYGTFLPYSGTPTLTGLPTRPSIDTASAYVIDTANYHDLVILNGGLRYDDYRIHTSGYATVNGAPNTPGAQSADFGLPNFNLGITVKPLPYASVYAAYATSSDPVGSEFDGTSATYGGLSPVLNGNQNSIFGPEKNKAAEVGTKWELFERHLLLSAALFQTTKDNAREAQTIANQAAASAIPGCTYNAADTGNQSCILAGAAYRIQGIDLEATGKITDRWSIMGGIVLMQSKVTKSNVTSANVPQTLLYTTNVGLPLANIAHQSFTLLNKYKLNDVWEVGGTSVYRSKIYGGTLLAANQGTELPGFWRFDAFAEAKIDKNWKVKLQVLNIFNKIYYDALYQSSTPFVLVGQGRAGYLVVSARF